MKQLSHTGAILVCAIGGCIAGYAGFHTDMAIFVAAGCIIMARSNV